MVSRLHDNHLVASRYAFPLIKYLCGGLSQLDIKIVQVYWYWQIIYCRRLRSIGFFVPALTSQRQHYQTQKKT